MAFSLRCFVLFFVFFLKIGSVAGNPSLDRLSSQEDQAFIAACKNTKGSGKDLFQHVYGNPQAAVFFVVYGSLSCGACAQFHQNVLKEILIKYQSNPNFCVVVKDYPTDGLSLRASLLAWCQPQHSQNLRAAFYERQSEWLGDSLSKTPLPPEKSLSFLEKIAVETGLSPDFSKKCLADQEFAKKIVVFREKERALSKLKYVPLVFLVHMKKNKVETVEARTLESLEKKINQFLSL